MLSKSFAPAMTINATDMESGSEFVATEFRFYLLHMYLYIWLQSICSVGKVARSSASIWQNYTYGFDCKRTLKPGFYPIWNWRRKWDLCEGLKFMKKYGLCIHVTLVYKFMNLQIVVYFNLFRDMLHAHHVILYDKGSLLSRNGLLPPQPRFNDTKQSHIHFPFHHSLPLERVDVLQSHSCWPLLSLPITRSQLILVSVLLRPKHPKHSQT